MDFTPVFAALDKAKASAEALGGDAKDALFALYDGIKAQQQFVANAVASARKPAEEELAKLLAPIQEKMQAIAAIAEKRKTDFPLHSKMVNEAAQALSWVLDSKPAAVVEQFYDSATFNGNKILKDNRGDANHMGFVQGTQAALKALAQSVKEAFPKGLLWGSGAAAAGGDSGGPSDTTGFSMDEAIATAGKVQAAGNALGGEAKESADAFVAALKAQKAFVAAALSKAKPDDAGIAELLKPTSEQMAAATAIAERRKNDFPLHSKLINEAVQGLAWVLAPSTVQTVEAALDAATFNGNKIMRDKRGEEHHMNYVRETLATLKALAAAVKAAFPKGLLWGANIGCGAPANDDDAAGGDSAATAGINFGMEQILESAEKVKAAAEKLGGEAKQAATAFVAALQEQKNFVAQALRAPAKPADDKLGELLSPTSKHIAEIGAVADKRTSSHPLHAKMLNEAAQALAWVLDSKPAAFVENFYDSATFNGNKILKDNRGDADHIGFVQGTQAVLKQLQAQLKEKFPKGLLWGAMAGAAPASSSAAPAAAASSSSTTTATAARVAPSNNPLLAALAQATNGGASANLRHVSDEEKLHKQKNREVKTVDAEELRRRKKRSNVQLPAGGDEKVQLTGRLWQVEHVWSSKEDPLGDEEPKLVEITETERSQPVQITRCVNAHVKISGKINSVQLLNCVQCVLELQDVVGTVSIANSTRIRVVVHGNCPSVIFDKSDVSSVHLVSQTETEIVTSMTSNINVVLPWRDPEVDIMTTKELPVPEQYQNEVVGNKIVSKPTDHSGG